MLLLSGGLDQVLWRESRKGSRFTIFKRMNLDYIKFYSEFIVNREDCLKFSSILQETNLSCRTFGKGE